jgi:transcriptional regulator GlxA family with amidase domain
VFPDVEVLDFCGPFEVFSVTRLDEARRREEPSPFEALLVAEHEGVVKATGGLRVIPDHTLRACPPLDDWIAERVRQVETLTSVCTGSMLLGHAGVLDGRRATTHWRSLDWMRKSFPTVTVEDKLHVVEDGDLLTSAGISAGIDMALRVVERHHGRDVALGTARNMEYAWLESNARRV